MCKDYYVDYEQDVVKCTACDCYYFDRFNEPFKNCQDQ